VLTHRWRFSLRALLKRDATAVTNHENNLALNI